MSSVRLKKISCGEPGLRIVGGQVVIEDESPSESFGTGGLLSKGGIGVQCTENATSMTSGGGLTVAGGMSVMRRCIYGEDVVMESPKASFRIAGLKTDRMMLSSLHDKFFQISVDGMQPTLTLDSEALVVHNKGESMSCDRAPVVFRGGVSINCGANARSASRGGSLTTDGGLSVAKDVFVGGKTTTHSMSVESSLRVSSATFECTTRGDLVITSPKAIRFGSNEDMCITEQGLNVNSRLKAKEAYVQKIKVQSESGVALDVDGDVRFSKTTEMCGPVQMRSGVWLSDTAFIGENELGTLAYNANSHVFKTGEVTQMRVSRDGLEVWSPENDSVVIRALPGGFSVGNNNNEIKFDGLDDHVMSVGPVQIGGRTNGQTAFVESKTKSLSIGNAIHTTERKVVFKKEVDVLQGCTMFENVLFKKHVDIGGDAIIKGNVTFHNKTIRFELPSNYELSYACLDSSQTGFCHRLYSDEAAGQSLTFRTESTSGYVLYADAPDKCLDLRTNSGVLHIKSDGRIGIGTRDVSKSLLTVGGNVEVRGNLNATGYIQSNGDALIAGDVDIAGHLNVTSLICNAGGKKKALQVDGEACFTSDIAVDGSVSIVGDTHIAGNVQVGKVKSSGAIAVDCDAQDSIITNGGMRVAKDMIIGGKQQCSQQVFQHMGDCLQFTNEGERLFSIIHDSESIQMKRYVNSQPITALNVSRISGELEFATAKCESMQVARRLEVHSRARVVDLEAQSAVITATTPSTDVNKGALVVLGGVGVGKDVHVGGDMVVSGDLTVVGKMSSISTRAEVVENNTLTLKAGHTTKDAGIMILRRQHENDAGEGDVVQDTVRQDTFVLGNQEGMALNEVKFEDTASAVDDYYKGWWVRVVSGIGESVNQTRQIVAYKGETRTATLMSPWTQYNPDGVVAVYRNPCVGLFYNEKNDVFEFASVAAMESKQQLFAQKTGLESVRCKSINVDEGVWSEQRELHQCDAKVSVVECIDAAVQAILSESNVYGKQCRKVALDLSILENEFSGLTKQQQDASHDEPRTMLDHCQLTLLLLQAVKELHASISELRKQ